MMIGTRRFFLIGLLVACGSAGILVYSLLPNGAMPAQAAVGARLWAERGCESCHTLYGQGGPYAPDLTHIVAMRGADYIAEFMVNPNAFHPAARPMPRFSLTVDETEALIAFLGWVGETETAQSWPPNPIFVAGTGGLGAMMPSAPDAEAATEDPAIARGRTLYSQRCASCHAIQAGVTGLPGPSLAGIADRAWYRKPGMGPEAYIRESILYPSDYIVEGYADVMQKNFADLFSSQELDDLIAFLMTLEEEP